MTDANTLWSIVWNTAEQAALNDYGATPLEAKIYAWSCCARATWTGYQKMAH